MPSSLRGYSSPPNGPDKIIPNRIIRWRGDNGYRITCDRVDEFYFTGMKVDSTIIVRPGKSILQIPFDVKTNGCKLRPDLMMTPCVQLYFNQMKLI